MKLVSGADVNDKEIPTLMNSLDALQKEYDELLDHAGRMQLVLEVPKADKKKQRKK